MLHRSNIRFTRRAWEPRSLQLRVLAPALLFVVCSCIPHIDLSRLDSGPADADGDEDGESDAESDGSDGSDGSDESDIDVVEEPVITGLNGTGAEQEVSVSLSELTSCGELPAARTGAARRLSDTLVVQGENLDGTSAAHAEGTCGQGRIDFTVEEESMSEVRLRLPGALTITAGGLFLLTLVTPVGEARAEFFVLQGERGPAGEDGATGPRGPAGATGDSALDCVGDTCTLPHNLVVEGDGTFTGDLDVAGTGTFDTLEANELTVTMSIWLPECPSGYERDPRRDIVLCSNGRDEMVKVGDFWVDRYESSVWQNADCSGIQYGDTDDWATVSVGFPYHGSFTVPLYACSVTGVTPSRYLTWFQAQSACAASGKRLLTNGEWQAAVAGTEDPGGCVVSAGGPRATGAGTCLSHWGAEDMIGNLWEWVEDWYGQGGDSDGGSQPAEYFGDGYWNVDAAQYPGPYATHLPAAALRGGNWNYGTQAGAFALALYHAPSASNDSIGFRCARGR